MEETLKSPNIRAKVLARRFNDGSNLTTKLVRLQTEYMRRHGLHYTGRPCTSTRIIFLRNMDRSGMSRPSTAKRTLLPGTCLAGDNDPRKFLGHFCRTNLLRLINLFDRRRPLIPLLVLWCRRTFFEILPREES